MFCKIQDFICTRLGSVETVLDEVSAERRLVQIKFGILPNTVE